jgi:hypothetical protein
MLRACPQGHRLLLHVCLEPGDEERPSNIMGSGRTITLCIGEVLELYSKNRSFFSTLVV